MISTPAEPETGPPMPSSALLGSSTSGRGAVHAAVPAAWQSTGNNGWGKDAGGVGADDLWGSSGADDVWGTSRAQAANGGASVAASSATVPQRQLAQHSAAQEPSSQWWPRSAA